MTTIMDADANTAGASGRRRREPLLAVSAVTCFVVTFTVLVIPHDSLQDEASADQVTTFFTQNYALQQSQTLMHSLGALAMLVFLARLATVVGRHQRPEEGWDRLVLAASSAVVAIIVLAMGLVSAAIFLTGTIDGELQHMLYRMGWDFHFKIAYLLPLVLLPACHVLRRERAAAGAVTWSGLLLGVLALASTLGNLNKDTMFVQYPVFMLFLLWILLTGLVMGLRGPHEPRTTS